MASANNYIAGLRAPAQGQQPAYSGQPAYGGQPSFNSGSGYLAPVPSDNYNGGFSPAQAGYNQADEFASDPNAPSWLREDAAPPSTSSQQGTRSYFEQAPPTGGVPEHKGQGFCDRFGSKFFSCLCYMFGILGGIVGIIIERRDVYILANAWQSTFVGIPCILICFCFVWLPLASKILWIIYAAICVALTIACVIVPHPRIFHLPFCIGNWAIKRAQSTVENNAHRYHHHNRTVTETTTLTSNVYV